MYVHPIGAIHMIRPERLLASAGRIYGDRMETLWGEFLPVPADSVTEVDEGDTVRLGDRTLRVAYTPGHAKHHVAYFEEDTGTAWVGDDAGIRIPPGGVIPVTPPPDVDVEAWNGTMARVMEWSPDRIVPTHFGAVDDPAAHFAELREELANWAEQVRASLAGEDPANPDTGADAARAREFAAWVEEDLRARMPAEPGRHLHQRVRRPRLLVGPRPLLAQARLGPRHGCLVRRERADVAPIRGKDIDRPSRSLRGPPQYARGFLHGIGRPALHPYRAPTTWSSHLARPEPRA